MNAAAIGGSPLARRRLLDLLGITRHQRRGRYASPSARHASTTGPAIVLVEHADAAGHPLLRAILQALGVDAESARVAGSRLPDCARVLLALGDCGVDAETRAPTVADLARDPAAKRALWRALRPRLRRG